MLTFALAAIVLIAIPGPNVVYIATRSMADGRRAGFVSALGLLTGTAVNVAAAAAGLAAVTASSELAFDAIRYAGAAYLIGLGLHTLSGRGEGPGDEVVEPMRLGRVYRQGVLVQLLNPKVALFFLTLFPQFVDPARGSVATQTLALGAILATLGFLADCGYAVAADAVRQRLGDSAMPSMNQSGRASVRSPRPAAAAAAEPVAARAAPAPADGAGGGRRGRLRASQTPIASFPFATNS